MEIFFTHSEANWFRVHGLFRVTAFSTDGLLRPGGEGVQKSVVYQNFTPPPQKKLHMKIVSPLGNNNF